MIVDEITLGIFLAALIVLGVVSFRKLSFLRTIDANAIPKDRAALVKKDLIANRLSRKFVTVSRWATVHAQPTGRYVQKQFQRLVKRVDTLEREYRVRAMLKRSNPDPQTTVRAEALLTEADALMKTEEFEKAEHKYIEVISLQPQQAAAFQGLGEVYLQKKDYDHAKESLLHAVRLMPRSAAVYLDLAEVYRLSGHPQKALEQCRKAVALEPNDPKNLHALLTVGIIVGDKQLAQSTLAQLEAANPDNQKLSEYKEQVSAMP